MSGGPAFIPFERQIIGQSNRACGAACLAMVYRSFGKHVQQAEIWPQIAARNASGSMASTTHLMVRDAQHQGLAAVAVQARHPLQALRLCRDAGLRAILNIRLQRDSPLGHYVVLLDIDETRVVVHDPFAGPSRVLPHAELLNLWQVQLPNAEIAGNVLIGVGEPTSGANACRTCETVVPPEVECPQCKASVALAPLPVIGCIAASCAARAWTYLCCPDCDFMWTFGVSRADEAARKAAAEAARTADPMKLEAVFAALDRFTGLLRSRPGVASHPTLGPYLDYIAGGKERLTLAMAEEQARQKVQLERLTTMVQAARQAEAAHRRRERAATMPMDALDGHLLAQALLENLGFVR